MGILKDYIEEFQAVHELDQVSHTQAKSGGQPALADLSADDLFLVTQLSVRASSDAPAVTVSKKLRWEDLETRIKYDFDIDQTNSDLNAVSGAVLELRNTVAENFASVSEQTEALAETDAALQSDLDTAVDRLARLSGRIDELSDETVCVSNLISLSVRNLASVVIENKAQACLSVLDVKTDIANIAGDIDAVSESLNNKIDKYTSYDISSDLGVFIRGFTVADGKITDIDRGSISDYVDLTKLDLACGLIDGTTLNTLEWTLAGSDNPNQAVYEIQNDCYLNIDAVVHENDAVESPLEVWLVSPAETGLSTKLESFNNPGGFSGLDYYNFYSGNIPVKRVASSGAGPISVVVKYASDEAFIADTSMFKTRIKFSELKIGMTYTANQADAAFVCKDHVNSTAENLGLYKIKTNSSGLVTDAETVEPAEIAQIVQSQISSLVRGNSDGFPIANSAENYELAVYDGVNAYVSLPRASTARYGVVKFTNEPIVGDGAQCIFSDMGQGPVYAYTPFASEASAGVVKTGLTVIENKNSVQYPLSIDAVGMAFTSIPRATASSTGLITMPKAPTGLSNEYAVYALKNGNPGDGAVYIPSATGEKSGVVRLGTSFKRVGNDSLYPIISNDDKIYAQINPADDSNPGVVRIGGSVKRGDEYAAYPLSSIDGFHMAKIPLAGITTPGVVRVSNGMQIGEVYADEDGVLYAHVPTVRDLSAAILEAVLAELKK